ncbi:MAG: hypothetical protein H6R46_900 [Proteobacteria bacterium]|nr:hypothetical protein [Pseudomonadota bacterium]
MSGTVCRDNMLCVKLIPLDVVRGLDQHVGMLKDTIIFS